MQVRWNRWLLLPVLGLCAALYFPGVSGPMLLDDYSQLEGLMTRGDMSFEALLQQFLISTSGPLGRPVAMFSFILDGKAWGNQLWHWKLTNILLHMLTAIALYWLIRALIRYQPLSPRQQFWIAMFATAVWALHPLHVSTVLYIVQRMTILATLFSLGSMAAYLEGRYRLRANVRGSYRWLLLSLAVFFPLAIFSKETGLLILAYLILIEWIIFPDSRLHNHWSRLSTVWKQCIIASSLVLSAVILWLVIMHVIGNSYESRPFTLVQRLLTEFRILVMYLVQVFAPSWSHLGFFHDDIAVSTGIATPVSTLLALILLAGLLTLGLILRKTNPIVSFGVLLFFASHLMESTIFPLELMFEHRNYLGSCGIILAMTALVSRHIISTRLFAVAGASIVAALALLLFQFTHTWGDKERLDTQLYAAHPDSPSAIAIMADRYVDAWSPHLAWELLDRPERAGYKLQALVIQCRLTHQLADSDLVELNNRVNSLIQSYEVTGLIELSNQWLDKQCTFSRQLFTQTLALALDHTADHIAKQKLLIYKAYFLRNSGDLRTAITTLEAAFQVSPRSAMPLFIATEWLLDAGDKALARQYYQRALAASDENRAITAEYLAHFKNRIAPWPR